VRRRPGDRRTLRWRLWLVAVGALEHAANIKLDVQASQDFNGPSSRSIRDDLQDVPKLVILRPGLSADFRLPDG